MSLQDTKFWGFLWFFAGFQGCTTRGILFAMFLMHLVRCLHVFTIPPITAGTRLKSGCPYKAAGCLWEVSQVVSFQL